MKNRILLTGGTGYIGSHTLVELLQNNYPVVVIDDLSNSSLDVLDGVGKITGQHPPFHQIDCCDYKAMDELFRQYPDIGGIIHFAASKAVGESVEKPVLYYRNNINSLLNLLDLMKIHEVSNLVFSSSCTVYGQPDVLPVTEDAPIKPATSPYGNTKQICEEIIRDTVHANPELKSIALRYFNPIGAHPSALIGELPNGVPANLLPFITQTAAGIRPCLSVFGDDYATPDGSAIRDYIYVVDLAKAHVVAVQRMLDSKNEKALEFFNLGTGKGLSVLELLNDFEKATGVKVNYKIAPRREGDIEKVWADPTFANAKLGWHATTPLPDVLRSAWKWELALKERRGKQNK